MTTDKSNIGLYKKLARVLGNIQRVPKNGRNNFHNYDYVTESDLVEHVRGFLVEEGIAFFSSVEDQERVGEFTKVKVKFTLIDIDSGASLDSIYWGEGQDKGDKGLYKAYTGALKYFLMKSFLIPSGDDPEADEEVDKRNAQKEAQRKVLEKEIEKQIEILVELGKKKDAVYNALKKEVKGYDEGSMTYEDAARAVNILKGWIRIAKSARGEAK